MKTLKKYLVNIVFIIAAMCFFAGCSSISKDDQTGFYDYIQGLTGNEFNEIIENPVILTSGNPISTFSMDVNTASYSIIRRLINSSYNIDKNIVRIEEMVNYFSYDYPAPQGEEPLSINTSIFPCPWNSESHVLTIGLRAEDVEFSKLKNNLVFLMDVSGSMNTPDRLGLMQTAFSLLVENLNDEDTVSIVTYAGSERVLLDGAKGSQKNFITSKIENLTAGGSTAGAKGIVTAYEIAQKYFIEGEGANNRVILATDGDFNVGVSSKSELEALISEKRDSGIYLTVLGFGYGNLKDNRMEALANAGNGNYAYIDTINEARKVLVEEIGGTLKTVAKDVKTQIEFNPSKVYSYRLLGYENKLLTNEDWENNEKDAGEIGAGHTVTAVYEIVIADSNLQTEMGDNYLKVSVRYKEPQGLNDVKEIYRYVTQDDITVEPDEERIFIAAVVEFALILRDSVYKGEADLGKIIERLSSLDIISSDEYKAEFLYLVERYMNFYIH